MGKRTDSLVGAKLVQFQCGREGSMFYNQEYRGGGQIVERCPVCGSKKVRRTGRTYRPVDENKALSSA